MAGGGYVDSRWQGDPLNAFDDDWEAGIPRVTGGCDQRVNKLKALGNALVPQVAYMVFQVIAAAEVGNG